MKKMRCLIACLCLGACTLFSCSDEENVSESTKLTPDEHKEKLEKIGLDAIAKVNAADHEDLLRTMDYFYEIVDNSNLEVERDESATAVAGMLKAAASICKQNNLGGISHFASPQNDLYAAAQYYGIYTYDESRNRWRRTDSENSLEFHFENQVGDPVVISVSASGSETFVDLYEDGGTRYQAMIPEHAEGKVELDGETLFSLSSDLNVNNSNRTADISVTFVANGYEYKQEIHATPSNASTDLSLTINGDRILSANASVDGEDMTTEEQINDLVDGYGDAQDLFKGATAEVHIMDDAIIRASCSNIKALVDLLDDLDESYDWREQEEQEYNDKVAEAYNKYMTAELYYTDGDNVIATLSMQSYFEPYDYYYGYEDEEDGYYDYEPVITFVSDESTFSMESYFDDVSFNDLINSAEDLADEYENYLQYLLN